MPKQTFFNLPAEKQQAIITTAISEFARVPFQDASIANIIKDADISRGSFYQYFEDKEDLFFYLLTEEMEQRHANFITELKRRNGDILSTLVELFKQTLKQFDDERLKEFYKNVFLHLNYKTEKAIANSMSDNKFNKRYEEIKPYINKQYLNVENDEELFHTVQLISAIMMQNFVLKFAKNLSNEEVLDSFSIQLKLLKRGITK
ncbi:MAG TPA: TetR/AcrR family transcriptional regulator [Bacillota bacterium]|nr:TetR/AcrR family transcriptional regulator [Bacillota bacterium]